MSSEAVGPVAPGATLRDGRYRLQRLLGVGGMATVWLAHDASLARPVAIKVMADTLAADPDWVRRFEREARAAASLNHANVVPVFDYGSERGRPFLVMQYVAGGTLDDRRHGGDEDLDVGILARELLDAIAHIHAAGLVHRDIKPANVLLDEDRRPRVTDFGIAQPRDATSLTRTGNVLGTTPYLAPEVLAGAPATARSDLFSCGKLLARAVGTRPHRSPRLDALICALTADSPENRPPSARAALDLLNHASTPPTQQRTAEHPLASNSPARTPTGPLRTAVTRPLGGAGSRLDATGRTQDVPAGRAASLRRSRIPAAFVAALLTGALIVLAIVVIFSSSAPRAPAPAPSGAPLQQQLKALQLRVDYATRH